MRFARGDMRDHIVSHKNDHGASYERYGVLQWRSRLKISFCEILGVVQFSTFATLSAMNGLAQRSEQRSRAIRMSLKPGKRSVESPSNGLHSLRRLTIERTAP